jgi:hypothetical protein
MKALTLGIALLGVICFAQADDAKAQIEAGNKVIHQAMMKKDLVALEKAFRASCTKDFVYMENGQKQNFETMLNNMKMGISSMKKITKAGSKILTLKVKGNTAVGTTEHTMEGIMPPGDDKKEHKMGFGGVAEETYVKKGGKWMMSKMVWKSQKMTMDGKPMPGGGG